MVALSAGSFVLSDRTFALSDSAFSLSDRTFTLSDNIFALSDGMFTLSAETSCLGVTARVPCTGTLCVSSGICIPPAALGSAFALDPRFRPRLRFRLRLPVSAPALGCGPGSVSLLTRSFSPAPRYTLPYMPRF